ncbi:MAG: recombinase family protein [Oscillospiraceae bacterium]|jgi:DNA invertase Pin-like site-specific DNA recombinase|nr:recombinase family protein [Oscillospiraceae bacterium]
MDTKQTAVYCRTALADELAMRAQERRIREYADRLGHGKVTVYRDFGQNGLTLDRPSMNALAAEIKAGKIGTVIAADISRIARNYTLVSEWLDMLNTA